MQSKVIIAISVKIKKNDNVAKINLKTVFFTGKSQFFPVRIPAQKKFTLGGKISYFIQYNWFKS